MGLISNIVSKLTANEEKEYETWVKARLDAPAEDEPLTLEEVDCEEE